MVKITNIVSGYLGTNTYFIYREGETDCIVIDPANGESALKKCRELGVECKYILLTHGHFDHVLGVSKLKDSTGAAIYIHEADAAALYDTKVSLGAMVGASHEPCTADFIVNDGDVLKLGSITLRVIATPGHTKGGVCYLFEEERTIFSGDTLFRLSVGRDDLPGGDGDELLNSIVYKLYSLNGDYRVLPGHLRETTLDFERKHNPSTKRWYG